MSTQHACTACRIIRKEIPAYVIAEDAHIIVFLSLENHPLVAPKTHIPDIFTLDEATGALIMQAAIRVANAVKAGLHCEGVYLTQANGAAAGQDLFHFHLHIYPRWHDDKLTAYWNTAQADHELRRLTAERIRTHLTPGAGVVPLQAASER
jgi:histidine triad (HIT) family protein